eukprot:c4263_g1_i1.p1 GENE.c4263_g1_i1~~c4263_g1_i1.p1  ORF type:complete len:358 (+),score=84.79 c4263_g1_i1:46-1119(+)
MLWGCVALTFVLSMVPPRMGRTNTHLSGRTLIFSDDFNTLNHTVWSHEITMSGGGNWEFEYYTNNRSNSFVHDGVLHIRPTLTADRIGLAQVVNGGSLDLSGDRDSYTSCTDSSFYGCSRSSNGANIINPVQSASIKTIKSFSFKYGVVEVRAKLPKGDWLWPAIWMLPKSDMYGIWPASGEIDIVESRGNANGYPGGVSSFGSTLHFGPFYGQDPWQKAHAQYTLPSGDFSQDFHVFGLEWTPTKIVTYLDDPSNIVLSVDVSNQTYWQLGGFSDTLDNPWEGAGNDAPFDQEFFLKFNLAVGGTSGYFPDGIGGKPWVDNSQTAALNFWNAHGQWYPTWQSDTSDLQIDWIHVYQ